MDFTRITYKELLRCLIEQGYSFQTFRSFMEKPKQKAIILRHDVDKRPLNSLRFAQIQSEFGIKGSYYFRSVPQSWDEKIIKEINSLGHEIGYHYENLTTCNGDLRKAILDFENNLAALRELVPVSTICMHGSPMSKYDSKDLWKNQNYHDYDLIGEPYFDIDFDKVLYFTDTGRRWDGDKFSVRDFVKSKYDVNCRSTYNIIQLLKESKLPDQIMFNFHPQRWHNNYYLWFSELLQQNFKNQIKRLFYMSR